jgi:integral membrane protein (TIGR01906 family)
VRRGVLETCEAAAAALAWAVVIIGVALSLLTLPVYTSSAVDVLNIPQSAGLSRADALHLAGAARGFVADLRYSPLPAAWRGRVAFDIRSVSHLRDVRTVIAGARAATGAAALLLVSWMAVAAGAKRWRQLRRGMRWGAWASAIAVAIAVLAAGVDFEWFFTAFHGVFFSRGTWLFSSDSMLIRLFPERFWIAAGVVWALLSLLLAGVLAGAARLVPDDERAEGSRKPEDV